METLNSQINIFDPVEGDVDYFLEHPEEQDAFYGAARKLPEAILNVLFGTKTPDIIESICQSNQLTNTQSAALSRLVRKVSVAEFYFGDLINELKKNLQIDDTKAKSIAAALISQLFNDALEDIKKMHKEKFSKNDQTTNPNNVLDLRKKDSP